MKETVYGTVSVDIPSGTQPDTVLKLRGKGVKDLRSSAMGDEFLHLKIEIPTSITKDERAHLEKLAELSDVKNAKKGKETIFDKIKRSIK